MQNVPNAEKQTDCGYISFWKKKPVIESKSKFTDMEIAIMEGGQSLENPKIDKFPFLKSLTKNTLP